MLIQKEVITLITPRQAEVLQWIVEIYSQSLEPVGSKTLLKESFLAVSPATIRNDMVALENKGLLSKAHTSSGRIPSQQGYRYYVDQIIESDRIVGFTKEDHQAFEMLIQDRHYSIPHLAKLITDFLVNVTGYTGFVLGQSQDAHRFQEIKIVPLSDAKVHIIVVTDTGKVENKMYQLNRSVSEEDLYRISDMINEELRGSLIRDAYQRMKLSIPLQIQRMIGYQIDFSEIFEQLMVQLKTLDYYVSGKLNVFDWMDQQGLDVITLKHFFKMVDGSKEMYELIDESPKGLNVMFGFDISPQTLSNVSIIYSRFEVANQAITFGLIGPATMPYQRMISLVQGMTEKFNEH